MKTLLIILSVLLLSCQKEKFIDNPIKNIYSEYGYLTITNDLDTNNYIELVPITGEITIGKEFLSYEIYTFYLPQKIYHLTKSDTLFVDLLVIKNDTTYFTLVNL